MVPNTALFKPLVPPPESPLPPVPQGRVLLAKMCLPHDRHHRSISVVDAALLPTNKLYNILFKLSYCTGTEIIS